MHGRSRQAQPCPPTHRCTDRVAVAFDVDGTLFDSEPEGHRIAFNAAFAQLGVDVRWDLDTYAALLGVPGGRRRIEHYLICAGWSAPEARDVAVRVHERKTELIVELALAGRIPARPGVGRLVRQLLDARVELHVVTTGSARWVRPLLTAAFGVGTFDMVITAEDVLELKPSPEAYLNVLQGTGLDARHVVAIEDSAVGLAAARSAGLACLVVRNSYASQGPFPGAALVCSGFEELSADIVLDAVPCQSRRPGPVRPTFGRALIPARRDGDLDDL